MIQHPLLHRSISPLKTLIHALTLALVVAAPAASSCLTMEAFPLGTSWGVGPMIALPDGTASLRPFQWSSGTWYSGGVATIDNTNWAQGSLSQELNLNNINLRVRPRPIVDLVTFAYADFGGNVNLRVNGGFVNTGDLSTVPAVVGGVNVAVTRIDLPGYHYGTVTLTSGANRIRTFWVGGQEFYVDDVCW